MFSFGVLGMIDDAVNWIQAAALVLAIGVAGAVVLISLLILLVPFGDKLPFVGPYAKAAPFVAFFVFGLFCALLTLQLADGRCDALRAADRQAAEAARVDRDDGISKILNDKYGPEVSRLAKLNSDLQGKVAHYAKRKPVVLAAGGSCKLGAAAHQLRP